MIDEKVMEIADELAELQRGAEILEGEGKSITWDQEHGDELMCNLKGPLQIHWMYSRKCIFSCSHCYNFSDTDLEEKDNADLGLMIERIGECQPYNVCLCGGEPLAWDPLFETVARLRDRGVPLVSIVTNGYLASRDALARLRDHGLTTIQFSVDGIDAESHAELRKVPDSFEKALRAVEDALTISWQDLSVCMTPTRRNIGQAKDYIRMFAEMGVRHIRFQPYMPLGRGALNAAQLQPSDEAYLKFHFDLYDAQVAWPDIFVDWGDPLEHLWFYSFTEANCWSTGISPNGWLELSPYIPVRLGDIKAHRIEDIWAKGIKTLWHSPLVRRLAGHVYCTDALADQEVDVFKEPPLHIDVFDPPQWEALMTTDDLDVFRRFTASNLAAGSA